ncbi:MAG: alpha/beta hydrolase, partial [Elainellaceae cyanobacterium]
QRPASQWVERVRRQIATLSEDHQVVETANLYGVGYQIGMPRDRDTLLAYVAEKYEGEVAASLAAEVRAMSGVEVRHVYDVLSALTDDAIPSLDRDITQGMFRSLDCRENVAFSDRAVTDAVFNDLELPQLGASKYSIALVAYDVCKVWPVEPADASEHTVLESDIPTLVLQGRYDTQTNTEMGRQATAGLSNGLYVEFSSTGHGALLYSACARDIGVAFVTYPDQALNTICTADLFPEFVLPDAALTTGDPEAESMP